MDQGTRTRSRSLGSSQRRAASSNPKGTSTSASLPASAMGPSLGLEPEVRELLLNRPAGLEVFLEGLTNLFRHPSHACGPLGRPLWGSLKPGLESSALMSLAFSVAALWTLALSKATAQGHKGVAAIVEDRTSTFSRNVAPRPEPGQPSKIITYRKLIQAGGTLAQPSLAQASAVDPYAREQSHRMAKLDAFFQMLLEDLVDAAELGLTVDNLTDAGSIQSLKESLMATPNQLSTERVGSLMAALKRWKRFALPKKYPVRAPTPLQLAEFLRDVSRGGPTAAASVWQALK